MPTKLVSHLTLALAIAAIALFCTTGCDRGQAQMGSREANLLGVVKYEENSYDHTPTSTFAVNTDELYSRKNFSGDKTTFLWGLLAIKDY